MDAKKQNGIVPAICAIIVLGFSMILVFPKSKAVFKMLSTEHMYIMGFIKFTFLATVGEVLAVRLTKKSWVVPDRIVERAIIWGFIGAVLSLMLKIYSSGIVYVLEKGLLPGEGSVFLRAFFTSVAMNASFGIVMMGFHKMTDKNIELKAKGVKKRSIALIASEVDWNGFINFTVLKTIPYFWIPAHTITFMLPPEYQIVMAAYLSIALGVILGLRPKKS